jgi:hypothetical protein
MIPLACGSENRNQQNREGFAPVRGGGQAPERQVVPIL